MCLSIPLDINIVIYVYIHTRTSVHPSLHLSIHACMHASIPPSMHACMHAYIQRDTCFLFVLLHILSETDGWDRHYQDTQRKRATELANQTTNDRTKERNTQTQNQSTAKTCNKHYKVPTWKLLRREVLNARALYIDNEDTSKRHPQFKKQA